MLFKSYCASCIGIDAVTVTVEVPKNLTQEQKNLLSKFAESCGEKNYAKREKFFKKLFKN